ncbi:MAG: hypothetical protein ACE5LQ_07590 [Candidatus Bipolaricaulia bacterium]
MVEIAVSLNRELLEQLTEQYRRGLLTVREVAEALGLSYRKAEALLGHEGIPALHVGPGETHSDGLDLAEKLSIDQRTRSS